MNTRRRALSVALGIGAAIGLILPIQAAVADSSPPDPYFNFTVESATLVARGAGANVTVSVTCFPETFNFGIDLSLSQRVGGGRLAQGYGYAGQSFECDGFAHDVVVPVNAFENAFKSGTALVEANAFACTPLQCANFSERSEVRIRNK